MSQETSQVTKKQHFVPQFYLRQFANAANEVERLDCEALRLLKPSGTRGLCYDRFFYGLTTGQPDAVSQEIEAWFQRIDGSVAACLPGIVERILSNEQIADEEKWNIALLMSMLWMRGPVMREQINRMGEEMTKKLMAMRFAGPNIDRLFDRFDRETGRVTEAEMRDRVVKMLRAGEYSLVPDNRMHLMMFDSMPNFANLFFGQAWLVYITNTDEFVTSDNPVVVTQPPPRGFYGYSFLERTHYFALSPKILIVAFHGKGTVKRFKRRTLFAGDGGAVLGLNVKVASHAHPYAYARERSSLAAILTHARKATE